MNQSIIAKLFLTSLLAATYGCSSKNDEAPKSRAPLEDVAPCHDGNGNQECTDEAKKVEIKEEVAPVAQESSAPALEPQASLEAPTLQEEAPKVEVTEAPNAVQETPAPAAVVVVEQAKEEAPAASTAEASAPVIPSSI